MKATTRCPRPCSLVVSILATGEHGTALVQWADGSYAIRLDTGEWCEAGSSELAFLRSVPHDRAAVTV